MTFTRVFVAAIILFCTTGGASFAADSNVLQRVQDRAAIEDLLWRYVRALDGGDAEAYAATFAPDGQFGRDEKATRGRDALRRMITDMRARNSENDAKAGTTRPAMYHVITNPHVEFIDKDHARFQAYWMTVFAAPGENPPARVAAAGREVDELVRLNGQWLIKLRDVSPKD